MERIGYFNGQIGNLDEMMIPLCDRSVFYGDAVYDAVLVLDRKAFALDLHLDRLYRSCGMTQIQFDMPRSELEAEIDKLLAVSPMGSAIPGFTRELGEDSGVSCTIGSISIICGIVLMVAMLSLKMM